MKNFLFISSLFFGEEIPALDLRGNPSGATTSRVDQDMIT
jgi:hypothetical protein